MTSLGKEKGASAGTTIQIYLIFASNTSKWHSNDLTSDCLTKCYYPNRVFELFKPRRPIVIG